MTSTVVDDFIPSVYLDVQWSSENASLGNTLEPGGLQDAPSIAVSHSCDFSLNRHSSFVVVLTDPDAPSRDDPKWSEFCHWIATGDSSSQEDADSSCEAAVRAHLEDVMPYKPPGPPKGTGKHRYVFLVLVARNGTTEALHPSKPSDRQHWGYDADGGETRGVRDWADENGLIPIGTSTCLVCRVGLGRLALTHKAGANFIYAEAAEDR